MTDSDYIELSDIQLVDLIVNEKKTCLFEILYHRYDKRVLDKCHSILKHRDMAKEFTLEIFSKVFEKLE